jgi:hypothetical protein
MQGTIDMIFIIFSSKTRRNNMRFCKNIASLLSQHRFILVKSHFSGRGE